MPRRKKMEKIRWGVLGTAGIAEIAAYRECRRQKIVNGMELQGAA